MSVVPDIDPDESQEWLEAFESVLEYEGPERAHYLLEKLIDKAGAPGVYFPHSANTAYINTIPPALEERSPGNHELEHRIRSYVRWNALAMVVHANKNHLELGGHIASFASAATLYDVGFNHFWHAPSHNHGGDLIYIQGHSARGIYARAFLEGRLTEDQLRRLRQEAVDGDYQNYKANDGAYVRKHFFGKYPELLEMVANMTDEDVWRLNRGGHDPHKLYAAYSAAVKHAGQPVVILAKTVKGYGMGEAGEGQNITHQQKKIGDSALRAFRDRFRIPISDKQIGEAPFYRPADDGPEMQYLKERMRAMGGSIPSRRRKAQPLEIPPLSAFEALLKSTEDREISTTMAFVRILNTLIRDKNIGKFVVPIVPDECRTFGMEGMFRQLGIYSSVGQLYEPQDAGQLTFYREDRKGQILEEGITEAGSISSWLAAATSYSMHSLPMIPFYIFYSMFGFQRTGDLAWAAGDSRARGFLIGGTSGRTTLNGEGLQHEDGHSHLVAATIPNCISYDPTFGYELAVIIQDGLRRILAAQEDVFYYITVMNEKYPHRGLPSGAEEGILKGLYLFQEAVLSRRKRGTRELRVQLLGSGTILREVIAAADLLAQDWSVAADVWSATSFNELRRDGLDCERWNLLHPEDSPRQSYVAACLKNRKGPVIAVTDYMKAYAGQIREFVPGRYHVLGTDGFGRSDTREKLRQFFEVDRRYVTLAALKALADEGQMSAVKVSEAIKKYGINPDKPNPITV